MTVKDPKQIAGDVMDTVREEPSKHGEEDFTHARAVRLLIEQGIVRDRVQRREQADALEPWVCDIVESLATDKSNDWSEELARLRQIRPDLGNV